MISEEELREDQELIDSAERGEWVLAENQEMWKAMLVKAAENTIRKDKRMNGSERHAPAKDGSS
jgi:hypothetical protein